MSIEQNLMDTIANTTTAYLSGMEEGARFERKKFETVILAYDRALLDKSLNMPTYLHMAIENARSEATKQNIAIEAGMQRDRSKRYSGGPEHDQTTTGSRLEAGA